MREVFPISEFDLPEMFGKIANLVRDGEIFTVTIETRKRSKEQNAALWGWAQIIGDATGRSAQAIVEIWVREFVGTEIVEYGWKGQRRKIEVRRKTSTLTVDEMSDLLSNIDLWALELGYNLPRHNL